MRATVISDRSENFRPELTLGRTASFGGLLYITPTILLIGVAEFLYETHIYTALISSPLSRLARELRRVESERERERLKRKIE